MMDTAGQTNETTLASSARVLAVAMLIASAANYVLNLVLARWLDLAAFGDASLMVTAMLGLTSVAVGLQLVTAKLAVDADPQARPALIRRMRRVAVSLGSAIAAGFIIGAPWLATVLSTASSMPFVLLGVGQVEPRSPRRQ